jgi:hypothetical protein
MITFMTSSVTHAIKVNIYKVKVTRDNKYPDIVLILPRSYLLFIISMIPTNLTKGFVVAYFATMSSFLSKLNHTH